MELFGFSIKKSKDIDDKKGILQVVVPQNTEGTRDVISSGAPIGVGGHFIEVYDSGVIDSTEFNLIKKYRELADTVEIDRAVSEIINDAITYEDNVPFPVKINLDNIEEISEGTKTKIVKEFEKLLSLLRFNETGYEIFRNWYVDGRIYFNLIIDKNDQKEGIQKIVHVDSLYIKKIRNIVKNMNGTIDNIEEFFIYKPPLIIENNTVSTHSFSLTEQAIKFTVESITYATSGLMDSERKYIISHLHKSIKPANQLAMLEDAVVVYRVARAPERRIFYIDVGNLPKNKAEEYLNSIMNRYRNKIAYNTTTGEISDNKRYMSMLEDFWLPRREGGKGTEIDTLSGGSTLGEMDDVTYFRRKLYESLNVPIGRLDNEHSMFSLGQDNEITREETKFSKFITRLRNKFARSVFCDMLRKHLILKNIITNEDWRSIESSVMFNWEEDSHFAEIKKLNMMKERIDIVQSMDMMIERYYSLDYIRKNILLQTEEESKELAVQRNKEKKERDSTSAFNNMGQDVMAQQAQYQQNPSNQQEDNEEENPPPKIKDAKKNSEDDEDYYE